MNENRTFTRFWRWSVLLAGSLGIWLLVRWIMGGSIPVTNSVVLWPGVGFTLPFQVSRAWDLLAIPLWVYVWGYWLDHPIVMRPDRPFFGAMEFITWWFSLCTIIVVLFQGILSAITAAVVIFVGMAAVTFTLWVLWLLIVWAMYPDKNK